MVNIDGTDLHFECLLLGMGENPSPLGEAFRLIIRFSPSSSWGFRGNRRTRTGEKNSWTMRSDKESVLFCDLLAQARASTWRRTVRVFMEFTSPLSRL